MAERSRRIRVGTWNTAWAAPARANRIRSILEAPKCHVLCVTEGRAGLLPSGGHVIDGGADWGYPIVPGRRKVLLWSEAPWRKIDHGPESMSGRFVAGATETPIGELTIVGVCIPWDGSHVKGGRRNHKKWGDHLGWLAGFGSLPYATGTRTIVLGDFNQTIPRTRAPLRAHSALIEAFEGLRIATVGTLPWGNRDDRGAGAPKDGLWRTQLGSEKGPKKRLIDHIAHSRDLAVLGPERAIGIFPERTPDEYLSDHVGVWTDFR